MSAGDKLLIMLCAAMMAGGALSVGIGIGERRALNECASSLPVDEPSDLS